MVSNHLHDVVLCTRFFIRPVNWSRFYTVSVQESCCSGSCVNLIALSNSIRLASSKSFDFIAPEENITAFSGILNPVAIIEFSNASQKSSPIHPTSPVEEHVYAQYRVSLVQTRKRSGEAFTPIQSISNADLSGREYGASSMMRVAVSIKLRFRTLETNGKLLRSTQVTFDYFHFVVMSQELDIERTGNIEFFSNLTADLLDATSCCKVNLLCREYQRSITGVNARKLYVFGDCVFYHFTILCNGIKFNLFRIFKELETTTGYSLETSAAIFRKFSNSSSS